MARRRPPGWQYSGVVRRRARGGRRESGRKKRRRSLARLAADQMGKLAGWIVFKVVNKRWRPLSLSEALIWLGAGAVCIAFLALLAKGSFLLALAVFILMAAFAWRELGEK